MALMRSSAVTVMGRTWFGRFSRNNPCTVVATRRASALASGKTWIAMPVSLGSLSSFYAAFEQRFHTSPAAFRQSYSRITKAATPSLPLPPAPVGQLTAVPSPTLAFQSALTLLR